MEGRGKLNLRITLFIAGLIGLALVYIFQQTDFLLFFTGHHSDARFHFAVNRTVRIFLNDTCMLLVLSGLFYDRKILKLALIIQLVDLFILFPAYLALKLPFEGDSEISSPFLSQLHRLIVNPTLMILLIPAVYYQKITKEKQA